MTKTAGWKPRALPDALLVRLKGMGYLRVERAADLTPLFRHPKHRDLFVMVNASNVPGDTDMVIAHWFQRPVIRLSVDELCGRLETQIARAEHREVG